MLESRLFKKIEPIEHTEYSIQRLLVRKYLNQAKYMMPNIVYASGHVEADMLLVRRGSGYAEEFEIKLTTSDFKADAKKIFKHKYYADIFKKTPTQRKFWFPNRFSYVIGPNVDQTKIEIPEYAGLYKAENNRLVCIKSPPLIHNYKNNWDSKIAKSACFRYLSLAKLMGRY